jgi:hypothetical protein
MLPGTCLHRKRQFFTSRYLRYVSALRFTALSDERQSRGPGPGLICAQSAMYVLYWNRHRGHQPGPLQRQCDGTATGPTGCCPGPGLMAAVPVPVQYTHCRLPSSP